MPTPRADGRTVDQLRPIKITRGFTKTPAGSVLWEQGGTVVLCTASVTKDVPPWFRDDRAGGWITAEYVMLPGSTPQRKPWPKIGHTDSRGTEIQRLIGRSLRAAIDLSKIGPHTIALDCQVLQADGGTRTACICAAWVALSDAIAKLPPELPGAILRPHANDNGGDAQLAEPPAKFNPKFYAPKEALVEQIAAVSVGIIDGEVRLDLDYADDSRAEVDLNVVLTGKGNFVEVQGSAETHGGFSREKFNQMLDLATAGCGKLMEIQKQSVGG